MASIQQVKIAQKAACIDIESHHANVSDISGGRTRSCTQLDVNERMALLKLYRGMAKTTLPDQVKKIYALWGQLAKDGKVQNDTKQACDAYCARFCNGVPLVQAKGAWYRIIESLKQWQARA